MTGFGAGWIPNQADCVDSGGNWNADARACDLYDPRCRSSGGTWDPSRLVCTMPDGTEINIRQWCTDEGRNWDEAHEICYDTYTADGCAEAGGYWDAASNECFVERPPPPAVALSKGATTALIATGGVVLVGLGLLYYAR
jgi:hypothetical protein